MTADNFIQRAAYGIWNFMRTPKFEYEIQSKKKKTNISIASMIFHSQLVLAWHYITFY